MTALTKQAGLTLIEILIALALSSAIITGIFVVFLSNRQAYELTEASVRVQESGRFAMEFLTQAIRNAGNFGCLSENESETDSVKSFVSSIPDLKAVQTSNTVIGNSSDGDAQSGWFDKPDNITLLIPTNNTGSLRTLTTLSPATFTIDGGDFDQNQLVLVSNCQAGDIIQLASGSSDSQIIDKTGSLRTDLYKLQNVVTEVTEVNVVRYWVDSDDNILKATFFEYGSSGVTTTEQDLLNGIENLQITYGVDTSGNDVPNYYDSITDIISQGDEGNIISVKLTLIAVSGSEGGSQNVVSTQQTITIGEASFTAPDLRLRKVFESTVALRNRID